MTPKTKTPATGTTAPRKRRGFFDFVLVLALGYGVYAKTPIGAVVETGVRVARGQADHPSWFSTFKGRETDVKAPVVDAATNTLMQGTLPASLVAAAAQHKVDVDALAALVAVRGSCDDAGRCSLQAPDRLAWFAPGAKGRVDVDVAAAALAKAAVEMASSNDELAIEALFTGPQALSLALEQSRKSSLEAPDDVEVHAPFFSPTTRRGPLQGALAVLLVHRLRTLAWPAAGFRITSPFGERIHPVTGLKSFHNGTDIGVPVGTPLHSVHNGIIKRASRDSISGNYLIIDHGLGVQSTYCHMEAFDVSEKQRTTRNGVLGLSGATGRITGPHLHYILRINDKAVNAEEYGHSPTRNGALLAPTVPDKAPEQPAEKPLKKPEKKPVLKGPDTPTPPKATTEPVPATTTTTPTTPATPPDPPAAPPDAAAAPVSTSPPPPPAGGAP